MKNYGDGEWRRLHNNMNTLNTLNCALKNGLKSQFYVLFVFFSLCVCVSVLSTVKHWQK